jgi:uncharacterized protein YggE
MTRSLCCLFGAILLAAPFAAAQEPANRIITVTGTATVHYLPDAARIQFRVRSSEPTLDDVRQANQKALKLVDEKLSALKIKDMKIAFAPINAIAPPRTSSGFRSGDGGGGFGAPGGGLPQFGQAKKGGGAAMADNRNFNSARVATLIVRDSDMDKLAEAIAKIEKALLDAEVVSGPTSPDETVSGLTVTFFRREEAEFRDEALTKAVQSALQKAKALARGAGVEIKETVSIVENNDVTAQEAAARSGRTTFASSSGDLEITVRVTVKCSY